MGGVVSEAVGRLPGCRTCRVARVEVSRFSDVVGGGLCGLGGRAGGRAGGGWAPPLGGRAVGGRAWSGVGVGVVHGGGCCDISIGCRFNYH